MTTARDIMSSDVTCIGEKDNMSTAARKLAELGVGAMPICGEDNRLKGMVTDRDIVTSVIAEGRDPAQVTAGELGSGKPITIGADDDAQEILKTMGMHKVRRLPVIDGDQLVGIVALADVVRSMPATEAGDLVKALSE